MTHPAQREDGHTKTFLVSRETVQAIQTQGTTVKGQNFKQGFAHFVAYFQAFTGAGIIGKGIYLLIALGTYGLPLIVALVFFAWGALLIHKGYLNLAELGQEAQPSTP